MVAINEWKEQKYLKQEKARLADWKLLLTEQRETLVTPEEFEQWQQKWDKLTVEKQLYLQRQEQRQLRFQLKHRNAKLERERQERARQEERNRQLKVRQELAREKAWLKRRQAIAERKPPALSLGGLPAPARRSDGILQLVFSYLTPVPGHDCAAEELLTHWRNLQRVAAVNSGWRAVALPTLYRTILIVIGDSQGIAASSTSDGDKIRLRSNIDLLYAAGQTDNAREVQIIALGRSLTADQLLRQLLLAGLGEGGVGRPRIERLCIDMRNFGKETQTNAQWERWPEALQALNDFLSRALPSLREIEYYGDCSNATYGCVPIERLIRERLRGPMPLRALRVRSGCWPKLTSDYSKQVTALPIDIECMEIEGPDESCVMPIPTMVANSLVKLTLDPVVKDYKWKLFEPEIDPSSLNPPLVFSSLKSLTLSFAAPIQAKPYYYRPERTGNYGYYDRDDSDDAFEDPGYGRMRVYYADWDDSCKSEEEDDYLEDWEKEEEEEEYEGEDCELYRDDVEHDLHTRFKNFPDYKPEFPVLTHLELRHPPGMFDVLTFAKSPISSLVLCCSSHFFERDCFLSMFPALRSLNLRVTHAMDGDRAICFGHGLSDALMTVSPNLQRLTLAMNLGKDSQLQISTPPPFADSLSHLTLEGEYGQHDVEHLLQLFPNLRSLSVCAIVGEPVSTVPELVNEYRRANAVQALMPLNASLRALNVHEKRYFSGYNGWNSIPDPKRPMAPELSHYRGLLVGLVCRLPALDTLRVCSQSVDGVNESIQAIIDSGVSPEHIACLQRLRVHPSDY
ncbi:hypothetical protein GGF42_002894 [Coemansia sp. RSA 2424]|nr:hypothetical protein GGF42_002894 [Coemansia sp. RSA 2424]